MRLSQSEVGSCRSFLLICCVVSLSTRKHALMYLSATVQMFFGLFSSGTVKNNATRNNLVHVFGTLQLQEAQTFSEVVGCTPDSPMRHLGKFQYLHILATIDMPLILMVATLVGVMERHHVLGCNFRMTSEVEQLFICHQPLDSLFGESNFKCSSDFF